MGVEIAVRRVRHVTDPTVKAPDRTSFFALEVGESASTADLDAMAEKYKADAAEWATAPLDAASMAHADTPEALKVSRIEAGIAAARQRQDDARAAQDVATQRFALAVADGLDGGDADRDY